MKTKYLFSKCVSMITRDTLFVDVYVGTSARDAAASTFIKGLTLDNSYFFKRYDISVTEFRQNVAQSLTTDTDRGIFQLPSCRLNVTTLARLIKSGDYDLFQRTFVNALFGCFRMRFSPNSAVESALNLALKSTCNAAQVKNLKSTKTA